MKAESIVLTVAGMCFGVLLGWVLATLNDSRTTAAPIAAAAPQASPSAGNERAPAQLDEGQVQALTAIIKSDPDNAEAAEQLGETYFRADRMEEAARWYGEAVRLDPKNIDASTQLGMSLFFTQGADPALAQFDKSLKLNPNHPRTLLSQGVVLWQGKRDLDGAAAAWRKIVEVAPETQEAQAAREGLQALTGRAGGADDGHPAPSQ